MLRNRATRADGTQFYLRQAFKGLEGRDIEGVQAIRVFARVPNLDRDIRMLLASVMVIVIVGFVSIVGVVFIGMIIVGIVVICMIVMGTVLVGMIVVVIVVIGMIVVGVVGVGMIVVCVVLVGMSIVGVVLAVMIIVGVVLIGIVFFLHGGGHVPIDVHLDHRARSFGVQQDEIPHVVE